MTDIPKSGAKIPTCCKMHRSTSHAILMYRRCFGTSHHRCTASQHVAGPIGPGCAAALILAILQPSNSKSAKPILKLSSNLTACRYHAFFLYEINHKGLGNFWNFRGFPAVFPSLIFSHSKLGIPFTLGQISIRHLQTASQLVL